MTSLRRPIPVLLIGAALLSLLVLLGRFAFGGPAQAVPTGVAQRGPIVLESPGLATLVPEQTLAVTARTAGTVIELLQRPGARLEAGDPILRTTNPEVIARAAAARDAVVTARSDYEEAVDVAAQETAEAEAELVRAQGEFDIAQMQFQAERQLREARMGSAISLERARIEAERGKQSARVAQLRLDGARARGTRRVESTTRTLQTAERDLKNAEDDLAGLEVRSPAAGLLASQLPRSGEQLVAGQLVAEVVSERRIAEVQVAEAFAAPIAVGQPVLLRRDGQEVEVVVASVGVRSTGGSITLTTTALPDDLDWRHDAKADARIRTGNLADAVTIDRPPGVNPMAPGYLYVVQANGSTAQRRRVEFGGVAGERVVVASGLEAGETVAFVLDTAQVVEL
jgi:multidrug resistance efflux pump